MPSDDSVARRPGPPLRRHGPLAGSRLQAWRRCSPWINSDFAVDNSVQHLCKTRPSLCADWGNDGDFIGETPRDKPLDMA